MRADAKSTAAVAPNPGGPGEEGGAGPHASSEVAGVSRRRGRSLPELAGLLVVLAALFVLFSVTSPFFLSTNNLLNIVTAIAVTGVLAVPGTMLLIAGQVDLSVGAGTALCGVIVAILAPDIGIGPAVLVALLAGITLGLLNGALVTVIGVNSLIVTLGGLAAYRGVAFLLADGQSVLLLDFGFLGTARPLLGIPMPVIIFSFVALLVFLILKYTVFGRNTYAIGANPIAARLVGIPSRLVVFATFAASGLAMAVAGLILTSQLSAAAPNAATGLELTVVTAIVLGGASLSGGRGSVLGTVVGLMIIGVLNNGLTLLNVSSYWQQVASGVLLVTAVSFDRIRERLSPTS